MWPQQSVDAKDQVQLSETDRYALANQNSTRNFDRVER